jgi:hypothetical protein
MRTRRVQTLDMGRVGISGPGNGNDGNNSMGTLRDLVVVAVHIPITNCI